MVWVTFLVPSIYHDHVLIHLRLPGMGPQVWPSSGESTKAFEPGPPSCLLGIPQAVVTSDQMPTFHRAELNLGPTRDLPELMMRPACFLLAVDQTLG